MPSVRTSRIGTSSTTGDLRNSAATARAARRKPLPTRPRTAESETWAISFHSEHANWLLDSTDVLGHWRDVAVQQLLAPIAGSRRDLAEKHAQLGGKVFAVQLHQCRGLDLDHIHNRRRPHWRLRQPQCRVFVETVLDPVYGGVPRPGAPPPPQKKKTYAQQPRSRKDDARSPLPPGSRGRTRAYRCQRWSMRPFQGWPRSLQPTSSSA